ncbi:MAG TPA: GMC family oxidoreductase [Blastocatellia bacterium]|jgi:choline dehydrogenase-like flavoprotein|nr:GMC family oxidoreductase [Blastocatellia bacterium]
MRIAKKKIYDVCVIGSGAAGGFMVKELTAAGADTILVEAGSKGRLEDLYIHDWPYDLPKRGFGLFKQASLYGDDIGNAIEYRGASIGVDRIRTLGGRTFHWNAVCLRFSADDFRERSLHGVEEDWPLSYEEIAPFYSFAERQMQVFGTREGLSQLPDGDFVAESPRLRCSETIARKNLAKIGIRLIPVRKAVLLKSQKGPISRGACHYCGHCMDVCDVRAVWSSDVTVIPEAMATGKLTLRLNSPARKILVDKDGHVSGVSVVDRITNREDEIYARIVIVCCAAIESPRLLLNSACEKYPNGLANSNDLVGRYLSGHITAGAIGYLKDLIGKDTFTGDGATDHAYIPRFNHQRDKRDYVGGWGMQMNYVTWRWPHHAKSVEGFGSAYKKCVRELQPAMFQIGAWGKVEHRAENRVTVDPQKVDKFGVPIPIVQFNWGENDLKLFRDMRESLMEVLDVCGVETVINRDERPGGFASHEVGTCRMGKNPKTSVVNSYCQSHEIKNLFVVDGSCFTTFSEKNPTLTIAALAVRSARHIAELRRRGEL